MKSLLIAILMILSTSLLANDYTRELDGPFTFTLPDLASVPTTFSYEDGGANQDKITVLLFFATWCKYCKEEVPQFQKLWEKYKDHPEVKLLAVRTFRARETMPVEKFVDIYGITFPMVSDFPKESAEYSKVAKMWGLNYVPETFIYGKDGVRVKYDLESTADYYNTIDAKISELLNN